MKLVFVICCLISLAVSACAQMPADAIATAKGLNFTPQSLSAEGKKLFDTQRTIVAEARTAIFTQMVADMLLQAEARANNTSVDALIAAEFKKIPNPSDTEIKAVYDSNRSAIGDKTLVEMRPQIIAFLRRASEQKAAQTLISGLKTKYKAAGGKDVNALDLKPADTILTINGKAILAGEFEAENKGELYEVHADIADGIKLDLTAAIFSALVAEEAKAAKTDTGTIIAAEITDKLREFSETERADLESAFQKRLFDKYAVKLMLKDLDPYIQNISPDDDPMQGKQTAPVTIVMFTDFQCSACAATHPVLNKAAKEYGEKVRIVVRDFPLTTIHENAFQAALAANAANAQGKYFEYIDILYRNQTALDAASLKKYAAGLGLNAKQFELDLSSEKAIAEVRKDMADGTVYGINGTPTIFVNGVKIRRLSADGFRTAVEGALKLPPQ